MPVGRYMCGNHLKWLFSDVYRYLERYMYNLATVNVYVKNHCLGGGGGTCATGESPCIKHWHYKICCRYP